MCHSCQVVKIQGKVCHEFGCPEKYKSETRECKECGQEFNPKEKHQAFCSDRCYAIFYNLPYDED
jgi:hypothetical protein